MKKKEYDIRYAQSNLKRVAFNLNKVSDADIISHLAKKSNVQGYLKELIREDMKK